MSLEKRNSDETWTTVSGDGIGVSRHSTNHDHAKIGKLEFVSHLWSMRFFRYSLNLETVQSSVVSLQLYICTLCHPQACTTPTLEAGQTADPLSHTCLFTITRVTKHTGTYKCVAVYNSINKFESNVSKTLEVVKMSALSGNVYFTTVGEQSRTLIATVDTPTFPSEAYFNLVT